MIIKHSLAFNIVLCFLLYFVLIYRTQKNKRRVIFKEVCNLIEPHYSFFYVF